MNLVDVMFLVAFVAVFCAFILLLKGLWWGINAIAIWRENHVYRKQAEWRAKDAERRIAYWHEQVRRAKTWDDVREQYKEFLDGHKN